jgi:hypothetical protein
VDEPEQFAYSNEITLGINIAITNVATEDGIYNFSGTEGVEGWQGDYIDVETTDFPNAHAYNVEIEMTNPLTKPN